MSVKVMGWVWDQRGVPALQKLTLLALADHANDKGACWPGVADLVEKTGLSERAIHYHIKALEGNGFLKKVSRRRDDGSTASNLYHIVLPWVQEMALVGATDAPGGVHQDHQGGATDAPLEPSLEPSLLELKKENVQRKKEGVVPPDLPGLHERFDPLLGASLVDEQIALALAHTAAGKYNDLHIYVQNWLRREAEQKEAGQHRSGGQNGYRESTGRDRMAEDVEVAQRLRARMLSGG